MASYLFSNLRFRLLVLVLIAIVPPLGVNLYAAWVEMQLEMNDERNETKRLTRLIVANEEGVLRETRQMVGVLSRLPRLYEADTSASNALLADLHARYPLYANLGVASSTGTIRCSATASSLSASLATTDWFNRIVEVGAYTVGGYRIDRRKGLTTLFCGMPTRNKTGQLESVLFAAVDMSHIGRVLRLEELPEGATLSVIDPRGIVLARYPNPWKWVGQDTSALPVTQTIVREGEGVTEGRGLDGVTRLFAFAPVRNQDPTQLMYVVIGVPQAVAFQRANTQLLRNLIGLALALILALTAAYVGSGQFVLRQVHAMLDATRRLAAGDFTARTGVTSRHGELNQLAQAFDEMAEELGRSRSELERRVEERTKELREINSELDAFAYSVSHDLRSPLMAVNGFASILRDDYADRIDDVGKDYLRRVADAAQQMDVLIRDLLAYSRASRTELVLETLDLRVVVNDVVEKMSAEFASREAEVTVAEAFPSAVGHRTTLQQVITNLLSNALKFVAAGVKPRVRVWAEERASWVRLRVEDNGIGIPAEYQERIFNVFERLHGSDAYPGTGIGLAIVRKSMARMGGRVGVESAPTEGSCFWVELRKGEVADQG